MHTLSFGTATRDMSASRRIFRFLPRARASLSRIATRAGTISPSPLVFLAEIILAGVSYALALFLLAQERGMAWAMHALRSTIDLALLIRLGAAIAAKLYRRSLRYANVLDLLAIARAVLLSSILLGVFVCWRFPLLQVPVAVFLLDAAFLQLFWGGLHFGAGLRRIQRAARRKHGSRAIVVGAGDAGMTLLKELALDSASPCRPVAVVDDDSRKWGRALYGVPVLGGTTDLVRIAAETQADEILICIPSATHAQIHDILAASRRSDLPVRSLPSLAELLRGTEGVKVSRRDLRSPRIEDLLQRDEVCVDSHETRRIVGGKAVLLTGAGAGGQSAPSRHAAAAMTPVGAA